MMWLWFVLYLLSVINLVLVLTGEDERRSG